MLIGLILSHISNYLLNVDSSRIKIQKPVVSQTPGHGVQMLPGHPLPHTACSTHTLTHSSHIPSLWLLLFPGPQRGSGHNLVAKSDASSSSHHFAPSVNSCIQFLLILPNLNIIILLNLSILCPSFSFGLDHLPGILQLLLAGNSGLILLI